MRHRNVFPKRVRLSAVAAFALALCAQAVTFAAQAPGERVRAEREREGRDDEGGRFNSLREHVSTPHQ